MVLSTTYAYDDLNHNKQDALSQRETNVFRENECIGKSVRNSIGIVHLRTWATGDQANEQLRERFDLVEVME